jgi:hypothetical protein
MGCLYNPEAVHDAMQDLEVHALGQLDKGIEL